MNAWTCEVTCTKCPYRAVVFAETQKSVGDPVTIKNIPKECPTCKSEVRQTMMLAGIPFKMERVK